ncbi:Mss4p nuclear export [Coemansia sp. RSA 2607]|nr:Mss4p nuclear export [Coemansia sp. RSA 2607]
MGDKHDKGESSSDGEEFRRSGSEEKEHTETVDKKNKGKKVQPTSDASPEPSDAESDAEPEAEHDSSSDSDSDSVSSVGSNEIVNVDFEFFDPHTGDFHAIKRLLQNTFGDDSDDFNLSELADLCISQPHGTTVKMDDEATSDPYAFLTAISLQDHAGLEVVAKIRGYLENKAKGCRALVGRVLQGDAALVISERIVNMPPQIVPPMLRMLVDELADRRFSHYIVLAPMYHEVEASDDDEEGEGGRRKKPRVALDAYVHAEDEFVEEFAEIKFDYRFSRMKRVAEARNSFGDAGIAPSRRCLIVKGDRFPALLERLNEVLAP